MNTVALHDISELIDYGVTASANSEPVGPKFLRITDIQNGSVDWTTVPYCEADDHKLISSRLRIGDIVFARTGATTGKSFLIRRCPTNAVFASYLIRVRPNARVDPVFLSHFFNSPDYWDQISLKAVGAAQPGVNASKLHELEVPLPPLSEQRRIAAILDQADALRAKRRAALAQLDEMAQAIFVEMFGDPFSIPRRWPLVRLGDLALKFSDGPFGSNLKSSHYVEHGIRVIRLQNIGVGEFKDEDRAFIELAHFDSLKKHECNPGDVLVGTLGDPNLRACIQPVWLKKALNKADCVQIRCDRSKVTPEYLEALLNHPSTERMAQDRIVGQTRLRISMGRLREMVVPVSPIHRQETFSIAIAKLRNTRDKAIRFHDELDTLFASLQHRAFRGEL